MLSSSASWAGKCNSTFPRWVFTGPVPRGTYRMIAMKYYTSTTEFNCGIDLHARLEMYVCAYDGPPGAKKLVHTNIKNNDFAYFLKRIGDAYQHDLPTVCAECMFGCVLAG